MARSWPPRCEHPGETASFLFAEGLIAGAADVGSVAHCGRPGAEGYGNVLEVRSAGGHRIDAKRVLDGQRWAPTTSACGVCGRRSIADLVARLPRRPHPAVAPELAARAVSELGASQPAFSRTGGLHAAAIRGEDGALLSAAEDVGRHNAVDKAVGACSAGDSSAMAGPALRWRSWR